MKTHLNLLPCSFRKRMLIRTRLVQWCVLWAICLVCVSGACCAKYLTFASHKKLFARLDRKCDSLRVIHSQNKRLHKRLTELTGRESLLAELESARHPLCLVGIVSQSARRSEGSVQIHRFFLSTVQRAPATSTQTNASKTGPRKTQKRPTVKQTSPEHNRLTLNGVAVDDLAVAKFIAGLRETGIFRSVELKSSSGTQYATNEARKYEVECTF